MKTIMDAVNELKGDLNNLRIGYDSLHNSIIYMPKLGGFVGTTTVNPKSHNTVTFICTIDEFKRCVFDLENWIGGDAVVGGVSVELVEEVVGCIFDCDLSESDAIQYAYSTLNNIDSEAK